MHTKLYSYSTKGGCSIKVSYEKNGEHIFFGSLAKLVVLHGEDYTSDHISVNGRMTFDAIINFSLDEEWKCPLNIEVNFPTEDGGTGFHDIYGALLLDNFEDSDPTIRVPYNFEAKDMGPVIGKQKSIVIPGTETTV